MGKPLSVIRREHERKLRIRLTIASALLLVLGGSALADDSSRDAIRDALIGPGDGAAAEVDGEQQHTIRLYCPPICPEQPRDKARQQQR